MTDKTYVDGIEFPGLEFPHVHAYTVSLSTGDSVIFDKVFKRFLAESVLACIDNDGAVAMLKNGAVVRIYLKQESKETQKKKSEFFKF